MLTTKPRRIAFEDNSSPKAQSVFDILTEEPKHKQPGPKHTAFDFVRTDAMIVSDDPEDIECDKCAQDLMAQEYLLDICRIDEPDDDDLIEAEIEPVSGDEKPQIQSDMPAPPSLPALPPPVQTEDTGSLVPHEPCMPETTENAQKLPPEVIADKVISKVRAINVNNILYAFDGTVYCILDPDMIKGLVLKYCSCDLAKTRDSYLLNMIYTYFRAKMSLQEKALEEDPSRVVYKDCRFNLEEGVFEENGPDVIAFSYVNVNMRGASDSHPVFDAFLDRATGGNERLKCLVWEMIGYILSADMTAKKFFVLKGASNTGKSLMLRILRAFFRTDVSEKVIPLHSLGERFALGRLAGIRLVTDGDYTGACLTEASTAVIKAITGGDSVRAEMKGQDCVTLKPCCKLVVASNFVPMPKYADDAFDKRRLIIPFEVVIPDSEQDPYLFDRICVELPAIARTALGYLIRLRNNRFKFTQVELNTVRSAAEDIITAAPSGAELSSDKIVADFAAKYCSFSDPKSHTLTCELYRGFDAYCQDIGQRVLNIKDFSTRLSRLFPGLSKRKSGTKNGYVGIALKSHIE